MLKLERVTVYGEFFNARGRVVKELEAEPLSRELIRHIRNSPFRFDGQARLSFSDGTVRYIPVDEDSVFMLNTLLEAVS